MRNPETKRDQPREKDAAPHHTQPAAERARRAQHPEKTRAAASRWAKQHPQQHAFHVTGRRQRLKASGGQHTWREWQEKRELLGNICFYCRKPGPLTRDHMVPITR